MPRRSGTYVVEVPELEEDLLEPFESAWPGGSDGWAREEEDFYFRSLVDEPRTLTKAWRATGRTTA